MSHREGPLTSYQVKNTFVEFGQKEEDGNSRRSKSWNLGGNYFSPGLQASKSPVLSPSLLPVDEAAIAPEQLTHLDGLPPALDCFDLYEDTTDAGTGRPSSGNLTGLLGGSPFTDPLPNDEPAYVVPMTPSPFLHSAFPPSGVTVPPFGLYGIDAGGLPPAFEDSKDTFNFEGGENPFIAQGWGADMYDPSVYNAMYPAFSWGAMEGVQGVDENGNLKEAAAGWEAPPLMEGGNAEDWEKLNTEDLGDRSDLQGASDRADRDHPAGRDAEGGRRDRDAEGDWRDDRNREGKGNRKGKERDRAAGRERDHGGYSREERDDYSQKIVEYPIPKGNPDNYTTVMLRNIPNKYTREMLIDQLNQDYCGQYDFMYLPIDFKNKCNVGYGFINFRTTEACENFVHQFHGVDVRRCLPGLNSRKVVEVTPARVQGCSENVRRLRNSPVMNQLADHPDWMPLLFNDFGEQEPFPLPEQLLPALKPRGRLTGKSREKEFK